MNAVLYLPLLCAVALAVGSSEVGRRASPKLGSAVLLGAALAVALAADTALAVLVGARLLDAAPLAALLGWHAEAPGPIPVPVPVSVLAGIGLVLVAAVGWDDWRRCGEARRALAPLYRHPSTDELVVVRSPDVLAFALPSSGTSPGRILVSEGMLRVLDPAERRVMLAHERAHLHNNHHRYRRLARLAARINPLLRPTVAATDLLLERWADQDAVQAVGSRRLTARALAKAAVGDVPRDARVRPAAWAAQHVSGRVNALLAGSPRGAGPALVFSASVALVACLSALASAHELAHLFDLLRGDG
jgi:hypothetical protein